MRFEIRIIIELLIKASPMKGLADKGLRAPLLELHLCLFCFFNYIIVFVFFRKLEFGGPHVLAKLLHVSQ
jgi:hypothetical protein